MYYIFGKVRSINDLSQLKKGFKTLNRSHCKIAMIDDNAFEYEAILKRHDFFVQRFSDIEDIKAMAEYEIILCDIEGVGKRFSEKYQGAYIIKELRKHYPHKFLIAYSSKSFDASFNDYFKIADFVLKKDIDSEEWIEKLDEAISKVADPIYQWKKVRQYLLDSDIPLQNIQELENDYVTNISSKTDNFPKQSILSKISSNEIKNIILSLASSIIFKLLTE